MIRTSAVLLAALSLAAAAWPTQVVQPPSGCYDMHVGLWHAVTDSEVARPMLPPGVSPDSTVWVVPPRVRFGNQPGGEDPSAGWKRIETPAGALPTGHRYQTWKMSAGRLLLSYSTGRVGVHGVLTPDNQGFEGVLRTFVDVAGTQVYERSISIIPVACSSPPLEMEAGLRQLPRALEMASGARIALGGAAPSGLRTVERPSGAMGVIGATAGIFAGSDSVAYRVGANDGRVGVIQAIFNAPAEADSMIARITRRYGEPDPNTPVPGGWWHSRITEVSVIPDPAGGFRVLLQDPRSW